MAPNDVAAHRVLAITAEDLSAFHASHFATSLIDTFTRDFLGPVPVGDPEELYEEGYAEEYEEEDDLGYYADGVKRTLTDEQIAMFRHSEIQKLLRKQRRAEEDRDAESEDLSVKEAEVEDSTEAEAADLAATLPTDFKLPTEQSKNKRGKTKKSGKGKSKPGSFKQNVKPDLRKRTWDKVETGMDSLDYGEEENNTMLAPKPTPSRRRISYDDD